MASSVGEFSHKPLVVAVGPLPPPFHGQAATTQAMLDYVGSCVRLHINNVSPGSVGGIRGHLLKAYRTFLAMVQLAVKSTGDRKRVLYMPADGGRGMLFTIAVACIARLFRYRIFLHHHSFAYIDRHSVLMAVLGRVMSRSDTHIVLCDAMAAGLRSRYTALVGAPMMELSSAAFLEAFPKRGQRNRGYLQMGFLSNLIVEKGLDTTIDLLRAARREGLPVRLLLAGSSSDKRATQIVQSALLEFGEAIEYLGRVSEQGKVEFFRSIDAFVFPSRYINEAQPRAIIESLCFGVPVVTIARSCITSDIGEGCGICVPPDADFVSSALPLIRSWCSNPDSMARYSTAALNRAAMLHEVGVKHLAAVVKAFG
jgi:glycosyltransferase involved in cell wall biosynthesis